MTDRLTAALAFAIVEARRRGLRPPNMTEGAPGGKPGRP